MKKLPKRHPVEIARGLILRGMLPSVLRQQLHEAYPKATDKQVLKVISEAYARLTVKDFEKHKNPIMRWYKGGFIQPFPGKMLRVRRLPGTNRIALVENPSLKLSRRQAAFISSKIKKYIGEGYPQKKAIAIAYNFARQKGYIENPVGWKEYNFFNVGRVMFYIHRSPSGMFRVAYEDTSKHSMGARGPILLGLWKGKDAKRKAFAAVRQIALQIPSEYRHSLKFRPL